MPLDKAGFVQGWLYAKDSPKEVRAAMDAVIDTLRANYSWPDELLGIQAVMNDQGNEILDLQEAVKELKARSVGAVPLPDPTLAPRNDVGDEIELAAKPEEESEEVPEDEEELEEETGDDGLPDEPPVIGRSREQYEWTDQNREDLHKLRAKGWSWSEIGRYLGRTGTACSSMWHALQKTEGKPREGREARIPADQVNAVREMMRTMNDVQIGQHYGYGSQTVADFRRRHGLMRPKGNPNFGRKNNELPSGSSKPTFPPAPKPTAQHGYIGKREDSTLQDSDWPDIEAMLAAGTKWSTIASDYDVEIEELKAFIARKAQQPTGPRQLGEAKAPARAGAKN